MIVRSDGQHTPVSLARSARSRSTAVAVMPSPGRGSRAHRRAFMDIQYAPRCPPVKPSPVGVLGPLDRLHSEPVAAPEVVAVAVAFPFELADIPAGGGEFELLPPEGDHSGEQEDEQDHHRSHQNRQPRLGVSPAARTASFQPPNSLLTVW